MGNEEEGGRQGEGQELMGWQTSKEGYTYIAESKGGTDIHKMDHLACFVGGERRRISRLPP